MATIAEALAIAFSHHQRGEIAQAQHIYRQIVAAEPEHAEAWHLLGVAEHQAGRPAEAAEAIAKAVAINPANATYYNHLGAAQAAAGKLDEAEAALRQGLTLAEADPQTHYNLAALLNLRSDPAGAERHYRRALELSPGFAEAQFNLGNLLRDSGRLTEAEAAYLAAAARPHYVKALMSLANIQLKLDKQPEAEASYRQVVAADPAHVEGNYWLGSLLQSQNRLEESIGPLQMAVLHNPRHFEAQNNLGCVFRSLERPDQAEQCFRLALVERPQSPEALSNLGSVLHDRKQYDEAFSCLERALKLKPDFLQAYINLGAVRQDQKRFDDALGYYRRALELDPRSADALAGIGSNLQMQGKSAEAIEYHRQAIALDADHRVAHYGLAAALQAEHRGDEALEHYAEAIRIKPDYAEAYYNRSFVWLSRGEFGPGFRDYEWRFRCKDYKGRRFDAPTWDGSPLQGRTLLIHAEQGLGDTLHFIRYVPLVQRLGGNLVVEVQPALVALLRESGFSVIAGGTPLPKFDLHVALMSLPGVLGTTLETVPAQVPYLSAEPRLLKQWRAALRPYSGFKVGLAWQGNKDYTFDHLRSIPLAEFAPLAEVPGVTLIGLQKNAGVEQIAQVAEQFTVVDLGSTLDNEGGAFRDTAAVMCNLDLIITSDTAAAHLAGALGVKVWVAVPASPEWRWLEQRSDSPWYPTMRLFRQPAVGDWARVFAEMQAELAQLAPQRLAVH